MRMAYSPGWHLAQGKETPYWHLLHFLQCHSRQSMHSLHLRQCQVQFDCSRQPRQKDQKCSFPRDNTSWKSSMSLSLDSSSASERPERRMVAASAEGLGSFPTSPLRFRTRPSKHGWGIDASGLKVNPNCNKYARTSGVRPPEQGNTRSTVIPHQSPKE